jgi:hypothetical protein
MLPSCLNCRLNNVAAAIKLFRFGLSQPEARRLNTRAMLLTWCVQVAAATELSVGDFFTYSHNNVAAAIELLFK